MGHGTALSQLIHDNSLKYEINCAGIGQQGYYVVEVSIYVEKKKDINIENVKRCAVHGVIFKGFSGERGFSHQEPILSPVVESENSDFFNAFFQKDYLYYVSDVDGTIQTMKVGKGYQVTSIVQVAKSELRKMLEQSGIIRKLGF